MVTMAKPPTANVQPLRPPLKWAGGKRWLLPHLRPLAAPYQERRLVEPLCGGLAVALGLMPRQALLNDVNPHNINFYRWLRKGLVIRLPMENESCLYYQHRARFNDLIHARRSASRQAAELFYYLNRTGYNGLCRFNRKGEFNVPFGQHATINYLRDFRHYAPAMRAWDFVCADFESLELDPDDFVYADPPYDVEFTQYSKEAFGWENQVRLAKWLREHPGPVVLSNQATARVVELYESLDFDLQYLKAPRMISCNGDRTPAVEVIAKRNL